jgi:hypothetical protein
VDPLLACSLRWQHKVDASTVFAAQVPLFDPLARSKGEARLASTELARTGDAKVEFYRSKLSFQKEAAGAACEAVKRPTPRRLRKYAAECLGLRAYPEHPGDGRVRPQIPADPRRFVGKR